MTEICRTCFQEVSHRNFIALDNDHQSLDIRNKIEFCLPEMDLSLTVRPVVCLLCVNILTSAVTFKKQCLETEHSIKKFMFGLQGFQGSIDLKEIYLFKNQAQQDVVEQALPPMQHTAVVEDLNLLLDDALNGSTVAVDVQVEPDMVKIEIDDEDIVLIDDDENLEQDHLLVQKDHGRDLQVESDFRKSAYETANTTLAKALKSTNKTSRRGRPNKLLQATACMNGQHSKLIQCEYCDFTSLNYEGFLNHLVSHKDRFNQECKPYFCPVCQMRSKWKVSIINHMKVHNIYISTQPNNGKKPDIKCKKCSFVTPHSRKWKKIMENHECLRYGNIPASA